jgi:hypothetical protein
MILPQTKFVRYRQTFFNKLQATPYTIELETVRVVNPPASEEFSMDSFVGDSLRESETHTFRALYEKEISDRTREKYGLPKEVNGIVYLSPLQLVPVYGDYHLDWNKTKIHFEGRTQVVNKIIYLEELYGSCVGVQIFVKDELKGG